MNKTIRDISENSYDNRTFPILYAQEDFTKISVLYLKDDEVNPYRFNYSNLVIMMKANLVNTQIKTSISNAPLL